VKIFKFIQLFTLLLILVGCNSVKPETETVDNYGFRMFSSKQLIGDMNYLFDYLEKHHPNLIIAPVESEHFLS